MLFRTSLAIAVLFLASFPAFAQWNRTPYNNKQNSPYDIRQKQAYMQPTVERFQAAGTIEAIAPGRIMMVTDAHENWLIWLNAQTKVTTVGEAKADFLYAGLIVQFQADLDKHRNVTGAIKQLTVITPAADKVPGIYPLEENQAGPGSKTPTGPCEIIGRITSLKGNKLQVNVGRGTVLADLSEDANIRLNLADYSMARKGDKITVVGMKKRNLPGQAQTAQVNQGQAVQVKIQLAETLAGMTKKSLPVKAQSQYRIKQTPKSKQPPGLPTPP
jgi:hypothetical protein